MSAKLATQFNELIRTPLFACQRDRPILIMLDALDECSPEDSVKEMLRILLLSDAVSSGGSKLRIFISSRPEEHIRVMFTSKNGKSRHERVVLHDIDDKIARDDIRKYLVTEFSNMHSDTRSLGAIPKNWPPLQDLNELLDRSGKFFAFAATVIRFVGDERHGARNAVRRLDLILCLDNTVKGTNPYLALDELYLGVLHLAAPKDMSQENTEDIRTVLATVVRLREPLSVSNLAAFLDMKLEDIQSALGDLHSVVLVPDDREDRVPVRFFHKSFPDFIQDKSRCMDERFLVDVDVHEGLHGAAMHENKRKNLPR